MGVGASVRDPDIPYAIVDTRGRLGRVIYFPPEAPPLDPDLVISPAGPPLVAAPDRLHDFAYEPFYAPLATLYAERALERARRSEVEDYLRARREHERELIGRLAAVEGLEPDARSAGLREFAREQTPALARLEERALELRPRLVSGRWFGDTTADWNATRLWRLGRDTDVRARSQYLVFEYQVMKAAPFYEVGLSAAQRRLLREVAAEMGAGVSRSRADAADDGFVFFQPETARVRLPSALPPRVEAMVSEFLAAKAALRADLREAVFEADAIFASATRRARLSDVARRHQPRFDAIEASAEAIRSALDEGRLVQRIAAPPPLPTRLAAVLAAYEDGMRRLEDELDDHVEETIARELPPHFSSRMEERSRPYKWARIRQREEPAFREKHRARFEEVDRLLVEFEEWIEALADTDARAIELLAGVADAAWSADEFIRARRRAEGLYLYDAAVFEPGLSPEQRRLLFAGALARLRLPLPEGQPQPKRLPRTIAR
jgi:hypothetical protein